MFDPFPLLAAIFEGDLISVAVELVPLPHGHGFVTHAVAPSPSTSPSVSAGKKYLAELLWTSRRESRDRIATNGSDIGYNRGTAKQDREYKNGNGLFHC